MKITKSQSTAFNEFQDDRGYVPEQGEDGFAWMNSSNIAITDRDLFVTTIEAIIDIIQQRYLDGIEVRKHRGQLTSMQNLHSQLLRGEL